MNYLSILVFILLSIGLLAQEKSYKFLYDFHQTTKLDRTENPNMSSEDFTVLTTELNRSYEIEVVSNSHFSFIKVLDKIENNQNQSFIKIEPEPKWLLNDFESGYSVNYIDIYDVFVKDSLKEILIQPTRNSKNILGFEAREFTAEDENNTYSFWLVKNSDITVSPIQFQFKGYIMLEANVVLKNKKDSDSERALTYILKDMKEDKSPFNFEKFIRRE